MHNSVNGHAFDAAEKRALETMSTRGHVLWNERDRDRSEDEFDAERRAARVAFYKTVFDRLGIEVDALISGTVKIVGDERLPISAELYADIYKADLHNNLMIGIFGFMLTRLRSVFMDGFLDAAATSARLDQSELPAMAAALEDVLYTSQEISDHYGEMVAGCTQVLNAAWQGEQGIYLAAARDPKQPAYTPAFDDMRVPGKVIVDLTKDPMPIPHIPLNDVHYFEDVLTGLSQSGGERNDVHSFLAQRMGLKDIAIYDKNYYRLVLPKS